MKNLFFSYVLCAAGILSPVAGLHRFYLDKPISGVFYLLTWGFFGIGTIIDLIRMPTLVEEYNLRLLFTTKLHADLMAPKAKLKSAERSILQCAHNNGGVVTVTMVALSSGLSMANAKLELDRLFREGFCEKDVDQDGHEIYVFTGFSAKKPL
jgi:TM2 domain-containing membrane protein YozV